MAGKTLLRLSAMAGKMGNKFRMAFHNKTEKISTKQNSKMAGCRYQYGLYLEKSLWIFCFGCGNVTYIKGSGRFLNAGRSGTLRPVGFFSRRKMALLFLPARVCAITAT